VQERDSRGTGEEQERNGRGAEEGHEKRRDSKEKVVF
jgi:hypothetical protein